MATLKPGFILEQTDNVAARERWFHEFLGEHPALLDEVGYVRIQAGEEPTLCFSAKAAKEFLTCACSKGMETPRRFSPSLTSLRRRTDGGVHDKSEGGDACFAPSSSVLGGPLN